MTGAAFCFRVAYVPAAAAGKLAAPLGGKNQFESSHDDEPAAFSRPPPAGWHWQMSRHEQIIPLAKPLCRLVSQCCARVERPLLKSLASAASAGDCALAIKPSSLFSVGNVSLGLTASATRPPGTRAASFALC